MKTYRRKISMLGLNSENFFGNPHGNPKKYTVRFSMIYWTLLDYENSPHEKIRFTEFNCAYSWARFQIDACWMVLSLVQSTKPAKSLNLKSRFVQNTAL